MMKKRLLVWAVFVCMIICSKNVYAADGGRTELPEGGLHPAEAQIADEAMAQQYEKDDNEGISIQSYTSELQVYKELERRIKSALLNGQVQWMFMIWILIEVAVHWIIIMHIRHIFFQV